MGRVSRGVRGIRLRAGDEVVSMVITAEGDSLLTVCENGYGKRTLLEDYRTQSRGGLGLINIKVTERNGPVVALKAVSDENELMMISANGIIIRTGLEDVRAIGRNTAGVRMIKLKADDKLVAVERLAKDESADEEDEAEGVVDTTEDAIDTTESATETTEPTEDTTDTTETTDTTDKDTCESDS
jgi:DNA gyrase subunit A